MDVVIFGCGNFASLAWYVLTNDSPHRVVGFTADKAYCTEKRFCGLPVIPFEDLENIFSADQVSLLIALGARDVNGFRAKRYAEAKRRGYHFVSYVSSRAVVWNDLKCGENCMIFDGAAVQPFAKIGDNCIIRSGAFLSHHVTLGDHCFVASHAVVGGGASVGERSFLGLNSTIRDGINIAPQCVVAAGAVVTKPTSEGGVYMGVPAVRQETPEHPAGVF